jgi:hypothetical protein
VAAKACSGAPSRPLCAGFVAGALHKKVATVERKINLENVARCNFFTSASLNSVWGALVEMLLLPLVRNKRL